MSTAVARNLMADMKLLGMFDAFERLVTEATRSQWSCTDFLDAMLQAESDFRSERKTKRRIKAAKFALRPSGIASSTPRSRSPSPGRAAGALKPASLRPGRKTRNYPPDASAGDPLRVGPIPRNRVGPKREILQQGNDED